MRKYVLEEARVLASLGSEYLNAKHTFSTLCLEIKMTKSGK